jgi:hypothetical protein
VHMACAPQRIRAPVDRYTLLKGRRGALVLRQRRSGIQKIRDRRDNLRRSERLSWEHCVECLRGQFFGVRNGNIYSFIRASHFLASERHEVDISSRSVIFTS